MTTQDQEDVFTFLDEVSEQVDVTTMTPWRIMVVDDDGEVHQATRYALEGLQLLNQPITLIHAYSAAEAAALLRQTPDVAAVLLDVVMESDDSGLCLIDFVRSTLNDRCMRIILRTGQPGTAPEAALVARYDIHDYMLKMDVSRERLVTSLTTAIRTYQQLANMALVEQQLSAVVMAVEQSLSLRSHDAFARFYMQQLTDIYQLSPMLVLLQNKQLPEEPPQIIATDAAHAAWLGYSLAQLSEHPLGEYLVQVVQESSSNVVFSDVVCLESKEYRLCVLLAEDDYQQQVLPESWRVFQSLMTICLKQATD